MCIVRTGVETGYETSTYVVGHVPGGDHGTTYWFWVDCTVPTTPPPPVTPNLPNTGNGPALAITALALVVLGAACLAASRRPEVER